MRKEILTTKTHKQSPKSVSFLFERGDTANLYIDCKLDFKEPGLHFAKLIYPNHIDQIWPGVLLKPVELPETGLTLGVNITIEEKHNPFWRLWQFTGMIATLGLYAPSRTFDTKLTYALLEFDAPPKDNSAESYKGHVTFGGQYSVYTQTYTKFLLGNLVPYRPDDTNCAEIDEELLKAIVEIRQEFVKDIRRAFP